MEDDGNGKRKANNGKLETPIEKKSKTVYDALTKEYFDSCFTKFVDKFSSKFVKIESELSGVKEKIKDLQRFKVSEETNRMIPHRDLTPKYELKDYSDDYEPMSQMAYTGSELKQSKKDLQAIAMNLKEVFNNIAKHKESSDTMEEASKDSSLEVLSATSSKKEIFSQRKISKIDAKLAESSKAHGSGVKRNCKKYAGSVPLQITKRFVPSHAAYDPFALVDENLSNWLDTWMKINRQITLDLGTSNVGKKFFSELINPKIWLNDEHIDAGMSLLRRKLANVPCPFRSQRLAVLDVPLTILVSANYQRFLENPNAFVWNSALINYYNGVLPECGRTNKRFRVDVDDVYVVLNVKNVHWIALAISILHRRVDVYDSYILDMNQEEILEFVKPYACMFPYLIKSMAFPADQDGLSVAEYKITSCRDLPKNLQSGDCGIYAMKYIECLALGIDMKIGLCDANIKNIRKQLATELFVEANHYKEEI